jgi:hypothetical protein
VLVGDACSGPPIIIKSHDLYVGNIRRDVGDIISYPQEGLALFLFLVIVGCSIFGLFLTFPFYFPYDGFGHRFFILFFFIVVWCFFKIFKMENVGCFLQ